MKIVVNSQMRNFGNFITEFRLSDFDTSSAIGVIADDFSITGNLIDLQGLVKATKDVLSVTVTDKELILEVHPFISERNKWVVKYNGLLPLSICFGINDVSQFNTAFLEEFERHAADTLPYRLYNPKSNEPAPLILFLHGSGNNGIDNEKAIRNCCGPILMAKQFPKFYIMAPQAPLDNTFQTVDFKSGKPPSISGWRVEYLKKICTEIKKLISMGKVNQKRVYVTGVSMGGAGAIIAMACFKELFAAAAPICPSMNEQVINYLKHMTNDKLWISTAYCDHAKERHIKISECVGYLNGKGNQNAHYTIYSQDELEKYDIGINKELTYEQRLRENHASWILTYNNEYKILDWMVKQEK